MVRPLLPPVIVLTVFACKVACALSSFCASSRGVGSALMLPRRVASFGCRAFLAPATTARGRSTGAPTTTLVMKVGRSVCLEVRRSDLLAGFSKATVETASSRIQLPAVCGLLHNPALFRRRLATTTLSSSLSSGEGGSSETLQQGDEIQVEIVSFGPLGASVDIVAFGHHPDEVIPETQPALGRGLILQREIQYFRQGRNKVDVVRGEILPAYVERVRENGSIDVSLRSYGGKAKTEAVAAKIMERLDWTHGGTLPIGDKSAPEEIQRELPGVSKATFKKAVSSLYKQGKVQPGPFFIKLMTLTDDKD